MMSKNMILASSSPRRIEMLKAKGIDPIIIPPEVDETIQTGMKPHNAVMFLALKKALFVESITLVTYLVAMYLLTSHFPHNLEIMWSAEIVYQIVLGLLSVWYFSGTHWQRKRI